MAHSPGQRNETGDSANRLTANKLGPSCRQMAPMNLQSLLIASSSHRPVTITILWRNILQREVRGIPVHMRRAVWFLICSKPVFNKCITSSYMLQPWCWNYVSMSTSTCSPTDESCFSVSSRGKRFSVFQNFQTDFGVHRTPYTMTAGRTILLEVKPPMREADHSVHRVTRLISLHGMYRDVFTFNFTSSCF